MVKRGRPREITATARDLSKARERADKDCEGGRGEGGGGSWEGGKRRSGGHTGRQRERERVSGRRDWGEG